MTEQEPASAQADVTIDADPQAVYHLITDLSTLASLAEEAEAMKWRKGDAVRPGAVFKGYNRNGSRRWTTVCTVTDARSQPRPSPSTSNGRRRARGPLALRHRTGRGRLHGDRAHLGPSSRLDP